MSRSCILIVPSRLLDRHADLGWIDELADEAQLVRLARERRVRDVAIAHGLGELAGATRALLADVTRTWGS
jgi:hypothetical protein